MATPAIKPHPDASRVMEAVAKVFKGPHLGAGRLASFALMHELEFRPTQIALAFGWADCGPISKLRKKCRELVDGDPVWMAYYRDARSRFDPKMTGVPNFDTPKKTRIVIEKWVPLAPPPPKPVTLPANTVRMLDLIRSQRGRMSDSALMRSIGVTKWTVFADLVAMAETGVRA